MSSNEPVSVPIGGEATSQWLSAPDAPPSPGVDMGPLCVWPPAATASSAAASATTASSTRTSHPPRPSIQARVLCLRFVCWLLADHITGVWATLAAVWHSYGSRFSSRTRSSARCARSARSSPSASATLPRVRAIGRCAQLTGALFSRKAGHKIVSISHNIRIGFDTAQPRSQRVIRDGRPGAQRARPLLAHRRRFRGCASDPLHCEL